MCEFAAVATALEALAGSNPLDRVKARVASIDFFPPAPFTALVEEGPPLHAANPRATVAVAARTLMPVRARAFAAPRGRGFSVVLKLCLQGRPCAGSVAGTAINCLGPLTSDV